jgi:RNA polymerase sigma factor (sigma-70 family)
MSAIFYEAKNIINGMNKSVEHLPRDSELRQLTELVEPLMMTEFQHRTNDEDFIEEVMEAYATIPKILSSYDASKGTRLTTWGWRLMRHAVLKFIQKADRRYGHEYQMDHWQEPNDEAANEVGTEAAAIAWQADTGWFGEPQGSYERSRDWKLDYEAVKVILEPREQEILQWMLEGQTQPYMAEKLGLSQSRVSRLISAIEGKIRRFAGEEA